MLKDKVSKEIDRLEDQKLLTLVETSEWVTPIVLMVKGMVQYSFVWIIK